MKKFKNKIPTKDSIYHGVKVKGFKEPLNQNADEYHNLS